MGTLKTEIRADHFFIINLTSGDHHIDCMVERFGDMGLQSVFCEKGYESTPLAKIVNHPITPFMEWRHRVLLEFLVNNHPPPAIIPPVQ